MAGDWIKIECDCLEKREILLLAKHLAVTADAAFALCFRAWRWAQTQTADGTIPGVDAAILDGVVGRPGFADALVAVGWLYRHDDALEFPNFERHMGKGAKKRAQGQRRMGKKRTAGDDPLPPPLRTPEFQKAWADWLAFRLERKPAVTPRAAEMSLSRLAALGAARAVAAIHHSIANSYQGIYEPREDSNGRHGLRPDTSRVPVPPGKYETLPDFAASLGVELGGPAEARPGPAAPPERSGAPPA